MGMQMFSSKAILQIIFGTSLFIFGTSSALADFDPNDNYSSLILSYKNANFANPVCIANECHEGVSGPAAAFSHQIVPNLALGLTGSYLQSSGSESSIRLTNVAVFAQLIAGLGYRVDVGTSVAALSSSLQLCTLHPDRCSSTDDNGVDLGVFGKVFLNDMKNVSLALNYDTISYEKAQAQSVVMLSLVTVIAKHHRLALSVDRSLDSNGNSISGGYGLGYSYLVF